MGGKTFRLIEFNYHRKSVGTRNVTFHGIFFLVVRKWKEGKLDVGGGGDGFDQEEKKSSRVDASVVYRSAAER
jgi:hypothetical protein